MELCLVALSNIALNICKTEKIRNKKCICYYFSAVSTKHEGQFQVLMCGGNDIHSHDVIPQPVDNKQCRENKFSSLESDKHRPIDSSAMRALTSVESAQASVKTHVDAIDIGNYAPSAKQICMN